MNTECENETNRRKMAMQIRAYQFAITDISLYLNTHPEDEKALCLHREYCKMFKELRDKYQKIYAYDITEESLIKLKENVSRYPNIIVKKRAITDKTGITYIKKSEVDNSANMTMDHGDDEVLETTLDDEVKEKITMIKMDIEGGEQKALRGAEEHIKKEHPKLLISVYHNVRDIFEIPKMIEQMDSSYQFYLRNYGGGVYPTEIVLIAI